MQAITSAFDHAASRLHLALAAFPEAAATAPSACRERVRRALVDFDEPEPREEFDDDDDCDDDDDDRDILTDIIALK